MHTFDEIQARVIKIVGTISGIPTDEIEPEATFEELDLDSLSRIEVLVELEREFEIATPDDEDDEALVSRIHSIAGAAQLVEQNLAAQSIP